MIFSKRTVDKGNGADVLFAEARKGFCRARCCKIAVAYSGKKR